MQRIIRNAIRCKHCGAVIESMFCGCCSVDGGHDYLRRGFRHLKEDYEELSETVEISPEQEKPTEGKESGLFCSTLRIESR